MIMKNIFIYYHPRLGLCGLDKDNNNIYYNQKYQSNLINIYKNNIIYHNDNLKLNNIQFKDKLSQGLIFRNFSYYEFPKYYSPTFDYENCEHKYFLGVLNTRKDFKTLEQLNYGNSIAFICDLEGNLLWHWDLILYLKENNILFDPNNEPIIQSISRLGKNKLNLEENIIIMHLSRVNQILFINPKNNKIEFKIDAFTLNNITSFIEAHIIPAGLPGEGNLLFYNNNYNSFDYSNIIEYDLINDQIVFQSNLKELDMRESDKWTFGSVQKLLNGNYFVYNFYKSLLLEISPKNEIIFSYHIKENYLPNWQSNQERILRCVKAESIPWEWTKNLWAGLIKG